MPIDIGHFIDRFFQPFNPESRYYWPAVFALAASLVANIVWYYLKRRGPIAPAEIAVKPWAFWINGITLIWIAVLMIAKVPFWLVAISIVVDLALLVYAYGVWLPPREAEWVRERRRQRYFPERKRKKRR